MIDLVSTIIGIGITPILLQQSGYAGARCQDPQAKNAPIATSGDNVYIAWWTNKTGNNEVLFRASSDGGKTFGDKINLSNSTVNSERAEMGTSGKNVFVTWWETMNGKDVPMLISDNLTELEKQWKGMRVEFTALAFGGLAAGVALVRSISGCKRC